MHVTRPLLLSAAVAALAAGIPLQGQSSLPTGLVTASDLVHLGSFTLPNTTDTNGNQCFEWANGVLAYNPGRDSLFVVGHDHGQNVAEISIPAMGGQAQLLQGCTDALNGKIGQINPSDPNSKVIGGLYVDGNRLIVAAYSYYDGDGSAIASHFTRSTTLTSGTAQGPYRVGTRNPGFYGGQFTDVPAEWQAALGAPVLNGLCCISIISRSSYGPSAFGLDPAQIDGRPNVPAHDLLAYPASNPLATWDSTGDLFNGTTQIHGMVALPGTNSLLYVGIHGTGPFCYGTGAECNDPANSSKGTHAAPYRAQVWAYRLSDLAAVRAGTLQPYDPRPYEVFALPGIDGSNVSGVAYDPATGRVFVTRRFGDGYKLSIHVYRVNGASLGSTPPPPPAGDETAPSVAISSPAQGATVSGLVQLTADASDDVGVGGVWFTVNGSTIGGEDAEAPYLQTWDASSADGPYQLRAFARDAAGNTAGSEVIGVTVTNALPESEEPVPSEDPEPEPPPADTTAPTVSLTSPTTGTTVSGDVTVTAEAADDGGIESVRFSLDGEPLESPVSSEPYRITWRTATSENGSRILRAIARDRAGNERASDAVIVTVNNDEAGVEEEPEVISDSETSEPVSGPSLWRQWRRWWRRQ